MVRSTTIALMVRLIMWWNSNTGSPLGIQNNEQGTWNNEVIFTSIFSIPCSLFDIHKKSFFFIVLVILIAVHLHCEIIHNVN